jgi:hypothetical protein
LKAFAGFHGNFKDMLIEAIATSTVAYIAFGLVCTTLALAAAVVWMAIVAVMLARDILIGRIRISPRDWTVDVVIERGFGVPFVFLFLIGTVGTLCFMLYSHKQ